MIKSELIQRIFSQNPHLYQRDIENIVNAIIDEIVKALGRGGPGRASGFRSPFSQNSRTAQGAQSQDRR